MKAVYQSSYEGTKGLSIRDVEYPELEANKVIVKVVCSAINDFDYAMVYGTPRIYRLMFGLSKPKRHIPGMEISGVVDQVSEGSTKWKVGDHVFADLSDDDFSGFAEFVKVKEENLTKIPENLTFHEAATIAHAGLLAYQGLITSGRIEKNEKVLINGAGGGMGVFAIQLAKKFTNDITGVDSFSKFDMMKELGCTRVIDYQNTDFTKEKDKYDIILDARTKRGLVPFVKSLRPGGRYVTVGGDLMKLIRILAFGWIYKLVTGRSLKIVGLKPNYYMTGLFDLLNPVEIKTVVDGPYPFDEIPFAIDRFGRGEHIGKIVIEH